MYLKKLTISGFKSFADKVTLNFDRGITGIVGPNGSGKSNVIDSVRWLMGEQNARMLRAEKATDIIFAGSEKRKSLNMAEVTLVFDNTEDDGICPPEYRLETEIIITRRLYADGEREYLINRKECRLKDVVHFLSLTGLSGRSYSMIQQGQVDRILNAKPEDVREILEEAAGTLMYKQRKLEAQKKLEETRLNLSRVDDILKEVEKQQAALQGQVEKAQQWKKISDELREEELKYFAHNYSFFKGKLDTIEAFLTEQQTKETELLAQLAHLESRNAELQQVLDDADPELITLNENLTFVRESIARAESTITNADSRMQNGEKRLQDLVNELAEEGENLKNLETQLATAEAALGEADREAQKLRDVLSEFSHDVDTQNESYNVFRSRIEDHEEEVRAIERLTDSNKMRSENLAKEIEKFERNRAMQKERAELLRKEIAEAQAVMDVAESKLSGQQSGLDKEIREKHERELALASAYKQIKDINDKREICREKYHETKARITSLEEMVGGATDAARSLKELSEKEQSLTQHVRGLLTDFVTFGSRVEELPKRAVSAFEAWAERAVLDSVDDFNQLIRAMQKHQSGTVPVTILSLLEKADSQEIKDWVEENDAVSLRDYFEVKSGTDAQITGVADRLYLVQCLQLEEKLIRKLPKGIVVFTSQGVLLNGPDDISIGSGQASGLLSRKTEVEQLSKDLKIAEGELAGAQVALDELDLKINEHRSVISEIDTKLQSQNKEVLDIMAEHQSARQILDHKKELCQTATNAEAEADGQIIAAKNEISELEKNRISLEDEKVSLIQEADELKAELSQVEDRREEMRRSNQQRETDLARLEARAQGLRENHKHMRVQVDLVQNKLSRRYEEQSTLKSDVEQAKVDQFQAQTDVEQLIHRRDELNEQILTKREANSAVHEELRVIEGRLRDARESQNQFQKAASDKNLEAERLRLGIESFKSQSLEKYHLDLTTYEAVIEEDYPIEKSGRYVQQLRNKLENIGPVNMMAMQEYEELCTRQTFITAQQQEINQSIEVLNQAIGEIELTSKLKFNAIFVRVNDEFGKLFPILFRGGEAHLELTHPDDPLQGGVEIMVRLPGKKTQRMNLFSGGEKALTAISLIFALLKTKPTPFCFLDEVDAPLDEANVGRYNRVLEALSEQFQFIVITHNRRTMEVLDTLYGVTMQEAGVSSVVGVDMKKDLPAHLKKAFKEEDAAFAAATKEAPRPIEGAVTEA